MNFKSRIPRIVRNAAMLASLFSIGVYVIGGGMTSASPAPDVCSDYWNLHAGKGHPTNQQWFNGLEVRTGEKGYTRYHIACVYQWGTNEWGALDRLWQLENFGHDRPNWHVTNIPQAKPRSKMPCADWDHRCQGRWGTEYIKNRYGTPTNALNTWFYNCDHSPYGCHY